MALGHKVDLESAGSPAQATGIFISYRRQDAASYAGRQRDDLSRIFGEEQIYLDIRDIPRCSWVAQQCLDQRNCQSTWWDWHTGKRWSCATKIGNEASRRLQPSSQGCRATGESATDRAAKCKEVSAS
jgi:hypothetical protein